MDNEIMESVLKEILEEQKTGAVAMQEINNGVKALAGAVSSFQKELGQQKIIAPPGDTKAMQKIVTDGILKIQQVVDGQPKTVTRTFRFLLFPEMYAENYYRIVFGRLLFWMMVFLIATYLFVLGQQGIESWSDFKQKDFEMDKYRKAWHYLYQHEKKLRVVMDSTWLKGASLHGH